ncbi:unnamed protein product [Didymodactylos carnosus]|uniref:Protein kinase domain-containing protein n=1 Tax=Didymodactylos carnosus TaxID=1234261 RepID=A0A815KDW4_9BILA|nr:unnamed protein product [Didymodactylos carnosus]CAF4286095.1 unnamed protein product [Didymodactylos carnosus]
MNNRLSQYASDLNLGISISQLFDKSQDEQDQDLDLTDILRKQDEILRLVNQHLEVQINNHESLLKAHQRHDDILDNLQKRMASIKFQFEENLRDKSRTGEEDLPPDLKIPFYDLRLEESIGAGGFGEVHRGLWSSRHQIVAIKKLHINHLTAQSKRDFINEVTIMARLHYEHVVTVLGACIEPNSYAIVLEYMSLGSLFDVLQKKTTILTWFHQRSIAEQMAKAINYLHLLDPPIFHRDIKSLNFLLEENMKHGGYLSKVCDFGLASTRRESSRQTTFVGATGTSQWMAPEIFSMKKYTDKSDVYSLGTVFWELVSGEIPYHDAQESAIRLGVIAGERLEIPTHVPNDFRIIIEKCWSHNPHDRPSCHNILCMLNETSQQPNQKVVPDHFQFEEYYSQPRQSSKDNQNLVHDNSPPPVPPKMKLLLKEGENKKSKSTSNLFTDPIPVVQQQPKHSFNTVGGQQVPT